MLLLFLFSWTSLSAEDPVAIDADGQAEVEVVDYFSAIVEELRKEWPKNRTVRFVFHGHSVPAGYFRTPVVRTFDSYPQLFHRQMCDRFPTAVIDACVTAIGGEHSQRGAIRFESEVLSLNPDVVFIDYCLNDRSIGLERAEASWRSMIRQCVDSNVRVVLLTPTPDSKEDLLDDGSPLMRHSRQVKRLGAEFEVPVIDSYGAFQQLVSKGEKVDSFLSQPNHPNRAGHEIVTQLLISAFTRPVD